MMTPRMLMVAARLALAIGAVLMVVLLLGPFQGDERIVGLNDKEAHAAAFALLTFTAFLALPRMRRVDLVLAIIAVGGAMEIAQSFAGRDGEISDLVADAFGCLAVFLPSHIEQLRKLMRERGFMSFADLRASDRRHRHSVSPNQEQVILRSISRSMRP